MKQFGQIHFKFGQIHFEIWTNTFWNLDKYRWRSEEAKKGAACNPLLTQHHNSPKIRSSIFRGMKQRGFRVYGSTSMTWDMGYDKRMGNDGFFLQTASYPRACFQFDGFRGQTQVDQQVWHGRWYDITTRGWGNDGFFLPNSAPAPRPALQPPFVKSPLS